MTLVIDDIEYDPKDFNSNEEFEKFKKYMETEHMAYDTPTETRQPFYKNRKVQFIIGGSVLAAAALIAAGYCYLKPISDKKEDYQQSKPPYHDTQLRSMEQNLKTYIDTKCQNMLTLLQKEEGYITNRVNANTDYRFGNLTGAINRIESNTNYLVENCKQTKPEKKQAYKPPKKEVTPKPAEVPVTKKEEQKRETKLEEKIEEEPKPAETPVTKKEEQKRETKLEEKIEEELKPEPKVPKKARLEDFDEFGNGYDPRKWITHGQR